MNVKLLILLMLGIWLGMVLGISFLEAPLKFRAPNITLTLGLGIGKLVFTALNKFESVFAVLLMAWGAFQYKSLNTALLVALGLLVLLIVLQSFWLLPILSTRADQLIAGVEVAKTNHHFYYVAMEIIKVGLLLFSFIKIYHHE